MGTFCAGPSADASTYSPSAPGVSSADASEAEAAEEEDATSDAEPLGAPSGSSPVEPQADSNDTARTTAAGRTRDLAVIGWPPARCPCSLRRMTTSAVIVGRSHSVTTGGRRDLWMTRTNVRHSRSRVESS
ncbi:MAG: hypothetical protein LBE67_01045 [Kocuria palustris]|nr:hypothetical protein [Kocuria palustris]